MFDQLSASAIAALLPEMMYTVPYFGMVDVRYIAAAGLVFIGLTALFWLLRMVILPRV